MTHAAEIRVMATAAIQEAYLELVPEFERATGNQVVTLWAAEPGGWKLWGLFPNQLYLTAGKP